MNKRTHSSAEKWVYAFFLLVFIISGVYTAYNTKDTDRIKVASSGYDFSEGWKLDGGGFIDLSDLSDLPEGTSVLSNTLPFGITDYDSINFNGHNVRFKVYTTDPDTAKAEPIYEFSPSKNLTGEGIGDVYHHIPLYSGMAGQTIYIEVNPAYSTSSSFENVLITTESEYVSQVISNKGFSFVLSMLIIFLGLSMLLMKVGVPTKGEGSMVSLAGLGMSAIFMGAWSAIETTIPSLIFGYSPLIRVADYLLLPLSQYPFVLFLNSIIGKRRRIYEILSVAVTSAAFIATMTGRFGFGADLHYLPFLPLTYSFQVILTAVMLVDNFIVTRHQENKRDLRLFYIGSLIFMGLSVVSLVVYQCFGKNSMDNGLLIRIGLVIFMVLLFIQIMRLMTDVRADVGRNYFINELLRYSMSGHSQENIIDQMIEFIGRETDAKRVYVFEETLDGIFSNTYEWCKDEKDSQKSILKQLPYAGLFEAWFLEFEKSDNVVIEDVNTYIARTPEMTSMARLLHIKNHIAAPHVIDGEYMGLFCVDDMDPAEISQLAHSVKLVAFFMSVILRQRNNENLLRRYSYRDQMTGAMNRRALSEFSTDRAKKGKSAGVLMCDISSARYASPDADHHPLLGIVFRDGEAGEGKDRVFLFFNPEDLTLIY